MTKQPLLVLDGNSIAHAAYYNNDLSANGVNTAIPYTFINSLHYLIAEEFNGFFPLVLWDGQVKHRREIYPAYKANRKPTTKESEEKYKDISQQRSLLKRFLRALGVVQAVAKDFEADDVAYAMVQAAKAPIMLVTQDRDWLQLLQRHTVSLYQHRSDARKLIKYEDFSQEAKVETVEQFVSLKALTGDPSDNIPGVGGIGEKTAIKLLSEYGSVESFIDAAKQGAPTTEATSRLVTNESFTYRKKDYPPPLDTYYRNLELVDLSKAPTITKSDIEYDKQPINVDEFSSLCRDYNINSWIGKDFEYWIKPFQRFHK